MQICNIQFFLEGPNENLGPLFCLDFSFHLFLSEGLPNTVIVFIFCSLITFSFVNKLILDSDDKVFTKFQSCLLGLEGGISILSIATFSKGSSLWVLSIASVCALNGTGDHLYLSASKPLPPIVKFVFSDGFTIFSTFFSSCGNILFSPFNVITSFSPKSIFLNLFIFCLYVILNLFFLSFFGSFFSFFGFFSTFFGFVSSSLIGSSTSSSISSISSSTGSGSGSSSFSSSSSSTCSTSFGFCTFGLGGAFTFILLTDSFRIKLFQSGFGGTSITNLFTLTGLMTPDHILSLGFISHA